MFSEIEYIRQLNSGECGAVCLAVVKKIIYNENILSELREKSFSSSEGWNLLQFKIAAKEFGLDPEIKYSEDNLDERVKFPAVVHWNFNHFVVLLGLKLGKYTLFDPALGIVTLSKEEFSSSFTGFFVEFEEANRARGNAFLNNILAIMRMNINSASAFFLVSATFLTAILNIFISIFPGIYIHAVFGPYPKLILITTTALFLSVLSLRLLLSQCLEKSKITLINKEASLKRNKLLDLMFVKSTSVIQSAEFEVISNALQKNIAYSGLLLKSKLEILLGSIVLLLASSITLLADWKLFFVIILAIILSGVFNYVNIESSKSNNNKFLGLAKWSSSVLHENLKFVGILESSNIIEKRNAIWENRDEDQRALSSQIKLTSLKGDLILDGLKSVIVLTFYIINVYNVYRGKYSWPILISLSGLMALSYDYSSKIVKNFQETLRLNSEIKSIDVFFETETNTIKEDPISSCSDDEIVRISSLTFKYHKFGKTILEDVNIAIKNGSRVFLSGKSGSGKSTIVKILSGSYPDYSKNVSWNLACRVNERLFLSQIPSIFNGSIRENVSCYLGDIGDENVWNALKQVELDTIVKSLPMGLETVISQDGPLSSGQTQRIALARVFILRPKFLVIDEATAFLDVETEVRILDRVFEHCGSVLYIGHKPSIIPLMDTEYNLVNGKCVMKHRENYFLKTMERIK